MPSEDAGLTDSGDEDSSKGAPKARKGRADSPPPKPRAKTAESQELENDRKRSVLLRRRSSSTLPLLEGSLGYHSLADLAPVQSSEPEFGRTKSLPTPGTVKQLVRRASTQKLDALLEKGEQQPYVMVGALSLVFGVLSVVPYNSILRSDPGSPLFIGFATHVFFVAINVRHLRAILFDRKIPLHYHVGCVALGFLFTSLKSFAFVRLPTSLCMLLMNLQMLVAMGLQRIAFGDKYSFNQMSGCALVTVGVMVGGASKNAKATTAADTALGSDMLIGVAQMLGAVIALTLLSMLVKVAFSKYGEHVEEQIVMQHLGALPLFFLGGQWPQIGPRLVSWGTGQENILVVMLIVNMSITFGGQATQAQFTGRAPSLLLVQLVDTVKKFASLMVTALLAAPPFPPLGFWAGSILLVLGTLQFLQNSEAPGEEDKKES